MITIVHPVPQLQKYNRVLQFISFPISMCFAIENVWITALMIAYETPSIIDSFIWILPNIISILIRPTLITYVHTVITPRQAQLSLVSFFMGGGAVGCFLVALSTQNFLYPWNIVICTIGWTIMDSCFELALYFCDKTTQRLQKLGYKQIQQENNYSGLLGEMAGYIVSFLLCYWKSGRTKKKFFSQAGYIYWIAAAIVGCYWLILQLSTQNKTSIEFETLKNAVKKNPRQVAQYLPGYYQLKNSTKSDRWFLGLHFTHLYIVDTLLIYGSMWIIFAYEEMKQKEGLAYNLGMKEGSLVLLIFAVVSYLNLTDWVAKHMEFLQLVHIFKVLQILICLCASLLFLQLRHHFIFSLAALIGIAESMYSKVILPKLTETNPVFQACMDIVNTIQKIFILCPMPFFIMIILDRDDINDCLVCIPLVVAALLILSLIWRDKEFVASEVNKIKLTKQL